MITLTCTRCGVEVGRTAEVSMIDKLFGLHDLHCANRGVDVCGACNGNGLVSDMHYDGSETTYTCPDCKGEGTLVAVAERYVPWQEKRARAEQERTDSRLNHG